MDFSDTPEEAEFRAEVREWLKSNAKLDFDGSEADSLEDGMIGMKDDKRLMELVAASKAWQARKFEAGYAAITWPKKYGGRDGSPIQSVIFGQEERKYRSRGDIFGIGLSICLPTVRAAGTEEQKEKYIRSAFRGDEIWCQLFSEPGAGSDLAGIRTRAVKDGDQWVINGQKIWTSGAHYCDYGLLLARTDPTVPKHKGLTMFVVDMKSPGVTVRPVRQFSGRAEFNEVFFDDLRVSDSDLIGEVGQGWKVAVTTLMFERNSVGGGLGFVDYDFILELARRHQLDRKTAIDDDRIRERIADLYINSRALQLLSFRAQTALSKGQTPGPEQSITKAVSAAQGQQASYLAMDLLGERGMLMPGEQDIDWGRVEWSWTWGAAMRIAGGTDEILRNIIAERVLGLPQDVRVDKDLPFDQIPH